MEKTQKILKRFISLILTFAISFGSYVFPVFAALPEDNETPTIEQIESEYDLVNDNRVLLQQEIDNINNLNPIPTSDSGLGIAKSKAIKYLEDLDILFNNTSSDPDMRETLEVKTTEYDVITVVVDFKSSAIDLGITLNNKLMRNQVIQDTHAKLQAINNELEGMTQFIKDAQAGEYFQHIIKLDSYKEQIDRYIEKLETLGIEINTISLYNTYIEQLNSLRSAENNVTNFQSALELLENMNKYLDDDINNTGLKQILKDNLLDKYTELKDLSNTNNSIYGMNEIITATSDAIDSLNNDTYDLLLSNDYETQLSKYNNLISKSSDPKKYIDSEINKVNKLFADTFNLKITREQMELIDSLIGDNPSFDIPLTIENLVENIDDNELTEKLITGELSYEVLEAYVNAVNNYVDMFTIIVSLDNDFNTDPELMGYIEEKFESNAFLNELNNIGRVSKTDEERLQTLNKLDLIEYFAEELLQNSPDLLTPITEKIEELREYYSKSADNNLTSLTINGIEMDVKEETYKVYVGNDVTELKVVFAKSNENAKVEILNSENLKVGANEVIVIVTAENGDVRQYTIEVIRAEATPVVATTETDNKEEVVVTPLTNNTSNETIEEEHKNTSDSAEKYDEEIEEKEGLSALTVFLIVAGIALVGYGIYKLFGDKEDQKIEKAFEQPKVNKNKPTPNKPNNTKKKNTKKRK